MGGQACVFYGAAQFSKDVDFLILADEENFAGLLNAMAELDAVRIAVPKFSPDVLERGHAVHFRCRAPGVEGLRIDVMTRLRALDDFPALWSRRTSIIGDDGNEINLLAVPDLVEAKKTQREKDWPVISALVEEHYHSLSHAPNPDRINFWLRESRTPERLTELTRRFPEETLRLLAAGPLLVLAREGDLPALRAALDSEVRAEQEKDRQYWEPLKREMEAFRREEREARGE
jgi:hypothetical protein